MSAPGFSRRRETTSACSRPPPPTTSSLTPGGSLLRDAEGVAGGGGRALRGTAHLARQLLRFGGVVVPRRGHVVPEGPLLRFAAPAGVLAAHDAVVFARRDPSLQLGRAHRVHRMSERQGVEDLVDDVEALVG